MTNLDIADLDCIFLSYDEPEKEEFWIKLRNMIPWVKRVDGVKGSDAAHKACAEESNTERFIVIDGDNMPMPEFFNLTFEFENKEQEQAVYRWRARNNINGLMYGNGGLSSWTKKFVMNMRTHESSDGDKKTQVEFCFDPLYWAMHDCYSTTYPNQSQFQAWRAGFREGVKMCLVQGKKPSIDEFKDLVHKQNMNNLTIWHNIGRDVENGIWAMVGAREGTHLTMLSNIKRSTVDWDYTQVRSFDWLEKYWNDKNRQEKLNPEETYMKLGRGLRRLDLPYLNYNAEHSAFFKHHYLSNWTNRGLMVREID